MAEKNYHTDNPVFLIYKDWEYVVNALDNNEQAGELFKALFAFAKRGEQQEFNGALKMAFLIMSQQLERDGEKWEKTCLKNSTNGKKGGRPTKAKKASGFSENPPKPNESLKDKDKEKDKEKDTDTEIDTEIDTETPRTAQAKNSPSSSHSSKPIRHKYGEYKNVLLSDEELEKLKTEIPDYLEYIERLSAYMASTGKTYKNHLATIRNWKRKDNENGNDNGRNRTDEQTFGETKISKYGITI